MAKHRDSKGRFTRGNRAAAGRKQKRVELEKALASALTPSRVRKIIDALFAEASHGDAVAARLLLDRYFGRPAAAPTVVGEATGDLQLSAIKNADDLVIVGQEIMAGVADGRIAVRDAAILSTLLTAQARVFELIEFKGRLDDLENEVQAIGGHHET